VSTYHPEPWRTKVSQNGLGLPHIVACAGTSAGGGNASTTDSARIAETTRTTSADAAMSNESLNNRRSALTRQSALSNQQSALITPQLLEYPMPLFEYECRGCGKQFE